MRVLEGRLLPLDSVNAADATGARPRPPRRTTPATLAADLAGAAGVVAAALVREAYGAAAMCDCAAVACAFAAGRGFGDRTTPILSASWAPNRTACCAACVANTNGPFTQNCDGATFLAPSGGGWTANCLLYSPGTTSAAGGRATERSDATRAAADARDRAGQRVDG